MAAWNKGKKFRSKQIEHSISIIESSDHLQMHEATARRHAKNYLLYKNGHMCSQCKLSEWMGSPIPLVCDHIDGKSTNNEINNFRLLCHNCDALLPTYKSKNRGNGRKYDREYKANGRLPEPGLSEQS